MRSALAVLLALTAAFFGLMGWSNAQLHQEAYSGTITARTLAGDPAAAAGIQITSYLDHQGHLFWVYDYPADDPQALRTRYGFSQAHQLENWDYSFSAFDIGLVNMGRSSTSSLEDRLSPSFLALLKAIQAGCPQVTTEEQTIFLSDYTDQLPLDVSQNLLSHDLWMEVTDDQLIAFLEDYFSFPVPDSFTVSVSLETDGDGALCGYNFFSHSTDCYLSSQYAVRNSTVLFALIPLGDQASLLDPSRIPGGWGVYALSGNTPEDLSLTTVYSVPNGGRVVRLFEGQEGDDDLYLLTVEQEVCYLTRLDGQSFQPTLRTPLFSWSDSLSVNGALWAGDGLAVFTDSGPFVMLVPDGAGGWRIDLEGDVSQQNSLSCFPDTDDPTSLLYDGERLAFTGRYWQDDIGRENPYLAIYDRDGLAYLGVYQSSLPAQVGKTYRNAPSHVLSWAETAS